MKPLRIAMVGQRGVPATFGGVEHHVEELGRRMADRGHEVTVFCRPNYVEGDRLESFEGMRLRYVPTIGTKHLDATVHSGLSALATVGRGYDVVHFHALGPGLFTPIPRAATRARTIQTIHGLDGERQKWGRAAQAMLKTAERFSARVPHETIVVSQTLRDHYRERYGRATWYIPNGVDRRPVPPAELVRERFGLTPGSYALSVGRLVPEKAPDLIVRAFAGVASPDARLVVAGGSSYTNEFTDDLERLAAADARVSMPGYVFGDDLWALYAHAGVFVLPSYLEGLPLTLLEAISFGVPVVASDIGPNVEVVGEDGPGHRIVPTGDEDALRKAIQWTLDAPEEARAGAAALRDRVLGDYDWDAATDATLDVYRHARPA